MNTYTPLPPHVLSAQARKYIASLDTDGRKLHEMAVEKLGSSYFVEKTHGFRKWVAAQSDVVTVEKEKKSSAQGSILCGKEPHTRSMLFVEVEGRKGTT